MNSVNLVGTLKEQVGEYRRFLLQLPAFDEYGNNQKEIFVRYWPSTESNYFTKLPIDSLISIVGHLDTDPKIGVYVVIEIINCLKRPV